MEKWESNPAVQNFREYLRIRSVHPDVDYDGCLNFLLKQAASMQLEARVVEVAPKKPVVIMTWRGQQPGLPAVLLNSHMDVVPVYEECWTHPPFEAHMTEDGWIYARGTQDMKSVGIQHLEAIRRLKEAGVMLKRTVHLTFVPDEEIGSSQGMKMFVKTKEFDELNVGVSLDESMPNPEDNHIIVFHGERITYQFKITCTAEPGHSCMMPSNTAGEKLQYIINKFLEYREREKRRLDGGAWLGDVTSVNLTQLFGGVQANVIPENLSAVFDVRLAPELDEVEFENTVQKWCQEAGEGVTYEFVQKNPVIKSTSLDDSNLFWAAIKQATSSMGMAVNSVICPGATDARFIRSKGIPAFGFSPMVKTEPLLHAHDEKIHADMFLKGIDVFENVVKAVANV